MSNPRRFLVVVLAAACVARLLFLIVVAHPEIQAGSFQLSDGTDEADYHRLAVSLAEDGQYRLSREAQPTALRPPGTVLPIALLYRFFGPWPVLGVVYVLACSLLIVYVIGALARETCSQPAVPLVAMAIAAGLPTLLFTAAGIWSDTPTLLFTLLSMQWLLRALRQPEAQRKLIAWAGVSLGLAYLNRPSAILTIACLAGVLLIQGLPRRDATTAALFAVIAAMPIAAWGLWNQAHLGRFFIGNTQSTVTLWQANNPVTAGLRPPAMRYSNGVDLHQEWESGRYRGSWIPLSYIAEEDPWSRHTLPEMEAEHWLRTQVTDFVRRNPDAFVELLAYKALRILTAEPTAPSVLAEGTTKRRLKRLATLAERWFLLVLGGFGMAQIWHRDKTVAVYYLLYLTTGLAIVFVAYPNARILLPVSATLIVPASIALVKIWELWRERAAQSP